MSRDELRAEYARLSRKVAAARSEGVESVQTQRLLDRLATLTEEYDRSLTAAQAEMTDVRAQLADAHAQLAAAAARLAEAQAQIAELKRQLFGSQAERLTPEQEEQLKQVLEDLEADAARPAPDSDQILEDEAARKRKKKGRGSGSRHPFPVHLEVETITIEPDLEPCPCCGQMPGRIGEQVREEIEFIPARFIRRRIVRPKYACPCGGAGVTIAPLVCLIPRSPIGLGLAVHITLTRFDDHLSFYGLERQFRERHGIDIPRQQMVQWIEHIATWLRPLVERMWEAIQDGGYVQVDETPVKLLDPEVRGKARRGYLWFYAVPGGDVVVEFDPSRGLQPARKRLERFSGTIQTDAYEVYQALQRRQSSIRRIGCLAHARRYFYKALRENLEEAVWFITQIRWLYRIEDGIRGLPPAERHARRQDEAPEIWEELKSRAQELQPTLLPQSTLGKAVNYFLNDYDALIGYLEDGRFEIDNNLVENSIRPTAVGRKRWLFIGHPNAGWRSAVIYSILVSCRRRGINPQAYLTDVLRRLPSMKISEIDILLPAHWQPDTS